MFFNIHFSIERWKFNKEYNIYVSTQGRFKDRDKNFIDPVPLNGYMRLKLGDEVVSAHRIVLKTFHPVADETLTVDHIDHNKRNNALSNLRWLPHDENCHDKMVEDFVESLKELGALEYIKGIRPAPQASKNRQKRLNKKNKQDPVQKATAMKIESLKQTTIFDAEGPNDSADGLTYKQVVDYINSKTGRRKHDIRHYLCCYMNEGKTEQSRFGYIIKIHYKETA